MADGFVAVAPDSTGKIIDTTELVVGTKTVERQRINVADPINPAAIQSVTAPGTAGLFASAIQGVINGVAVLISGSVSVLNFPGTQPVSGTVSISTLPGSPAQDGTDATGVVVPAGAVGIRGWLSGIYRALTGTLNVGSGTVLTILTPTSPTAVTSIKTSAGRAVKLVNASTSAQNVTISLFNESTTVGAAATLIYSAILGASQVIALDILVPNGLSYSLSAAPLANIIVVSS